MSQVLLKKIQVAFQGIPVLEEASLTLNPGEKVGLVGRNGCGKTTLLQVALGTLVPDEGTRTVAADPRMGMLAQTPDFGDAETVLAAASRGEAALNDLANQLDRLSLEMANAAGDTDRLDRLIKRHDTLEERFRLMGGYAGTGRVEAVLTGIGFKENEFPRPPTQLSGGEAKRLQLATLLLGGHDILFLDEPGNHLDLAGTEWLTGFLRDYRGSVLIVSHDRYLLTGAVDKIVEIEEGRTHEYKGNYDVFLKERLARIEAAKKLREAQEKEVARGEEFIRRNFYGQKSRQAKSKRKMLDRVDLVRVPSMIKSRRFRFPEASTTSDHLARLEGASACAGGNTLFQGLNLDLEMGETLGIIGPNGSGKSTLLKLILGQHPLAGGTLWISPRAETVYFDQALEGIGSSGTVLEEMWKVTPKATAGELRSHLGRFSFSGEEGDKSLDALSGGERSRALLAKIALTKTNLLVLDEPTNHLDIYLREALEEAIQAFRGAVLMVSHDRHLLDGVVDRLLILGDSKPRLHIGNFTSHLLALSQTRPRTAATRKARKEPKQTRSAPPRVKRRHTFEELENLIITYENRLKEIEVEIYREEIYTDAAKCKDLEEEKKKIDEDLKTLYEEWDTWS